MLHRPTCRPARPGALLLTVMLPAFCDSDAAFRHSITLKGGYRSGLLLGDGPGIGKGRQIAGIIFDNFRQGRTKAMWFSVSADLKEDARRDFVGGHVVLTRCSIAVLPASHVACTALRG